MNPGMESLPDLALFAVFDCLAMTDLISLLSVSHVMRQRATLYIETLSDIEFSKHLDSLGMKEIYSLGLVSCKLELRVKGYLTWNRGGRKKEIKDWVENGDDEKTADSFATLTWTKELPLEKYNDMITAVRDGKVSVAEIQNWCWPRESIFPPADATPLVQQGFVVFEETVVYSGLHIYGIGKKRDVTGAWIFCVRQPGYEPEWVVNISNRMPSKFYVRSVRRHVFVGFYFDDDDETAKDVPFTVVALCNGDEIYRNSSLKIRQHSDVRFGVKGRNLEILESNHYQAFLSRISLDDFRKVTLDRFVVIPPSYKPHRIIYFCGDYIIAVAEVFVFHPIKIRWKGNIKIFDRETAKELRVDKFDNKLWSFEGVTRDGIVVTSGKGTLPHPTKQPRAISLIAPFDVTYMKKKLEVFKEDGDDKN